MDLHIDNCVAKYKALFPLEDNPSKTGETRYLTRKSIEKKGMTNLNVSFL